MKSKRKAKLEAAGWAVGSTQDFLKLSDAEAAYIEAKVALAEKLRAARTDRHLSQIEVAKRLHSSQSRVAKMEAADPSVTVDLLVRSLFRLGIGTTEIFNALLMPHRQAKSGRLAEPKTPRSLTERRDARRVHAWPRPEH
jgi:transcriptional regulator with XRE-family HTH domain